MRVIPILMVIDIPVVIADGFFELSFVRHCFTCCVVVHKVKLRVFNEGSAISQGSPLKRQDIDINVTHSTFINVSWRP